MKPILFNTEMVRAILEGRKTETRRVIKPQPGMVRLVWGPHEKSRTFSFACCGESVIDGTPVNYDETIKAPYWTGDILWVRETWAKDPFGDGYIYPTEVPGAGQKWRPSIHMPREAARIFLRVTDIRAEKLQDIALDPPGPENRVIHEGFMYLCDFIATWNNIIKPEAFTDYCWDANPWCWTIKFKRITKREAGM